MVRSGSRRVHARGASRARDAGDEQLLMNINTVLFSPGAFLEFSGLLFVAYVVLARRTRSRALARLDDDGFDLGALAAMQPLSDEDLAGATRPVSPLGAVATAPQEAPPAPEAPPLPSAPPPVIPPREERIAQLESLVRSNPKGAVPALSEALRSADHLVAEAAANLLGKVGGPAALQALLAADTPAAATAPPANWSVPDAPPAPPAPDPVRPPQDEASEGNWLRATMEQAFHTPFQRPVGGSKEAPEAPVSALPALRLFEPLSRNGFRALHRYCPHDPRDLGEGELAAVLLRLAENRGEKPALRYFATKNLVDFQHRDVAETLLDLLSDPLPLVRYAAADALATHGGDEAVPFLVEALGDPEGSVRASAAHTLAVLGGDIAIRPLLELREDPDEVVRYAARRALDSIGRRKKITHLLDQA